MWEADIYSTNNLKAFIQVKSLHAKFAGTAYCQLDLSKLFFVKLKAQIQNIYLKNAFENLVSKMTASLLRP